MAFNHIDGARIHGLHADAIASAGGSTSSDAKPGCVEASVGAAVNAALYLGETDDHENPDPLLVGGHLLYYLAKNHCYEDGNKRVAWLAATDLLLANGLTVSASQDEAADFVDEVVRGLHDQRAVVGWLARQLAAA